MHQHVNRNVGKINEVMTEGKAAYHHEIVIDHRTT